VRLSYKFTFLWMDIAPGDKFLVDLLFLSWCSIDFDVIFVFPYIFHLNELGGLLPQLIHIGGRVHAQLISKRSYLQIINHIMQYDFRVQIFHLEGNHAKYVSKGSQTLSLLLPYVEEGEGGNIILATRLKVGCKG